MSGQSKKSYYFGSITILTLLVIAVVFYVGYRWENKPDKVDPILENQANTITEDQNSVTGIDTTSGTSSTSGTSANTQVLPDIVKAVITNFYQAYGDKDKNRLAILFTIDETTADKTQHSILFTGKDLDGNIAGPNLFVSESASQYAKNFEIIKSDQDTSTGIWTVAVQESRLNSQGQSVETQANIFELKVDTKNENWLVNAYYHQANPSKYNGFLIK